MLIGGSFVVQWIRAFPFVILVALVAGCASPDPAADAQGAGLQFTDTDGVRRDVPPEGANATIVFFMASWCPTCKQETPMVAALHEAYAPRGVQFYSLDFDPTDTREQIEAWKARYAQPWPHGVDDGMAVQRALGITAESSIAVLDVEGTTTTVWVHGSATEAAVRAELDRVLAS